jgi:nucleoid DNA-binding protein
LGQGYNFTIPDFGTFNTKIEEVQKVYHPNYGKFILMPPKRVVEFYPAENLKENLKNINP